MGVQMGGRDVWSVVGVKMTGRAGRFYGCTDGGVEVEDEVL